MNILIALILACNDIISFGLVKTYYLKQVSYTVGLLLPTILYSFQIPLFYYGLKTTSMTILNITWNLLSNILITLMGIFYFKEKINGLKTGATLLAFSSLILFYLDSYISK
jgi:hypothetical protein